MVCEKENEPVPDEAIVKGLEIDEAEYVVVEPEDLAPETDRTIEVSGFIGPETIDPRFYDRPYHLVHCVDPFKDERVTEGLRYYRLHGVGGYKHQYTDDELQTLAEWRGGEGAAYYLFNNVSMFEDAKRFQTMIAEGERHPASAAGTDS